MLIEEVSLRHDLSDNELAGLAKKQAGAITPKRGQIEDGKKKK